MSYAIVYLATRFVFRVVDFFHHWYIDASAWFLHKHLSLLEQLDQTFAVRVTMRHFKEPLYGDYSFVGRLLGFVFRSGRIAVGWGLYAVVSFFFLLTYVLWLLIPLGLGFIIIKNSVDGGSFLPY